MNRRNFIKTIPAIGLGASIMTHGQEFDTREQKLVKPTPTEYPYYVNCYIQNQQYWPLEEYKRGFFDQKTWETSFRGGGMGEKFINGKLRFYGFAQAVDFVSIHSRIVTITSEVAYEIFHDKEEWRKQWGKPPKHIYNYWAKTNPLKEMEWIHPDYIDHEADGCLIEYV